MCPPLFSSFARNPAYCLFGFVIVMCFCRFFSSLACWFVASWLECVFFLENFSSWDIRWLQLFFLAASKFHTTFLCLWRSPCFSARLWISWYGLRFKFLAIIIKCKCVASSITLFYIHDSLHSRWFFWKTLIQVVCFRYVFLATNIRSKGGRIDDNQFLWISWLALFNINPTISQTKCW